MDGDATLQDQLDFIGLRMKVVDLDTLDAPSRRWADLFAARGYVYVIDENESNYYVRPAEGQFILGVPFDNGISLSLWDDFFNDFTREDFASDDEYLDAVEARFATLWKRYFD